MPDKSIPPTRPAIAERDLSETEHLVDETLEESFPASDPPAWAMSGRMSVAARHAPETLHDAMKSFDQGLNVRSESSRQHIVDAAFIVAEDLYRRGNAHIPKRWRQGAAVMRSGRHGHVAMRHRIVDHPFAAVAVAGAVGCALGWLLSGRLGSAHWRQWRREYNPGADGPLRRAQIPKAPKPAGRIGRAASSTEVASHTNNSF
jgi:hypothetical protein